MVRLAALKQAPSPASPASPAFPEAGTPRQGSLGPTLPPPPGAPAQGSGRAGAAEGQQALGRRVPSHGRRPLAEPEGPGARRGEAPETPRDHVSSTALAGRPLGDCARPGTRALPCAGEGSRLGPQGASAPGRWPGPPGPNFPRGPSRTPPRQSRVQEGLLPCSRPGCADDRGVPKSPRTRLQESARALKGAGAFGTQLFAGRGRS